MFDNRVQKMSVRCPRTAGLSRAGAQPLADRCSVLTVEVEPPVPYLYHHKTFKCTHLLGQRAGLLGRVEDFVVEDGEVEGQAQPDGVCWLHVLLADVEGVLVSLLRVLHRVFTTQKTQQSLFFATWDILYQTQRNFTQRPSPRYYGKWHKRSKEIRKYSHSRSWNLRIFTLFL